MEGFVTTFEAPARHQRAVLRRLLELHRSVDLLQRHGVAVPPGLGSEPQPDAAAADAAALELLHRLPLTTYADYEQLVEEALAAACAVSPADPASKAAYDAALARLTGQTGVYAFWCTSGSMGKQKRLPASQAVTESNMEAYAFLSQATAAAFPGMNAGKDLRFSFARDVETLPNGVKLGMSSAITYRHWVMQPEPMVRQLMTRWPSPPEVMVSGDARTAFYLQLLCALCVRHEVVTLSGIFSSSLFMGASILINHWQQLLADVAAGRCFSWLDAGTAAAPQPGGPPNGCAPAHGIPPPPADVAAAVDATLSPRPELATELQAVFEGGRAGLLERLFPRLLHINAVMTGSMSKYVPHLRQLAPTVPFLSSAYGATEGKFGIQSDLVEFWAAAQAAAAGGADDSVLGPAPRGPAAAAPPVLDYAHFPREPDGETSYILMPQTDCFMEFIPYEHTDEPSPPTVSLEEVQVGQRYELVVTNVLGLFRYRIGDILRCVGHFRSAPKVVVEGRAGQALNLGGEMVLESAVVAAVRAAADAVLPGGGCALREWAVREVLHPAGSAGAGNSAGHYCFYWELAPAGSTPDGSSTQPAGPPDADTLAAWAAALDAALLRTAPNCKRGRLVEGLELKLVAPGAFEGIRQLAYAAGATAAQYKPPVVVSKPEQWRLLEGTATAAAFYRPC